MNYGGSNGRIFNNVISDPSTKLKKSGDVGKTVQFPLHEVKMLHKPNLIVITLQKT